MPVYFHRAVGGVEAERAERERWINKEQQRIMDSIDCKSKLINYSNVFGCRLRLDSNLFRSWKDSR